MKNLLYVLLVSSIILLRAKYELIGPINIWILNFYKKNKKSIEGWSHGTKPRKSGAKTQKLQWNSRHCVPKSHRIALSRLCNPPFLTHTLLLYPFSNLNTHTQNTRNYNKIKFNNHPLYSNLLCLNLIKVYIPPRSLLLFSSQINSTTPSFHANPPLFQVTMFIVYPHLIS